MKKRHLLLASPALVAGLLNPPPVLAQGARPPLAERKPHPTKIHGYTLEDDYFWLRDKQSPEVITYLEAENAYTEEQMRQTKDLQ